MIDETDSGAGLETLLHPVSETGSGILPYKYTSCQSDGVTEAETNLSYLFFRCISCQDSRSIGIDSALYQHHRKGHNSRRKCRRHTDPDHLSC